MPIVNFISPDNEHRSRNESSRRAQNLYTENVANAKSPKVLIGTPGTQTYTKAEGTKSAISSIQGDGNDPNTVTVNTGVAHGLSVGQLFNIKNTTNYNDVNLVVLTVPSTTSVTYKTSNTFSNSPELAGDLEPTGESPFTEVDDSSSCRGLYFTSTSRLFTVFAEKLFEVINGGEYYERATIGNLSTNISMADDGQNLVLVDGTSMYVYDLSTNTINNITGTLPFTDPLKVVFINQRFVCINEDETTSNNGKFFWTEILDANDWPALNFATAESSADKIVSCDIVEGNIWFFGPRSYEVWRTGGNPDLPFDKIGGSSSEIGCSAPNSVTSIGQNVFFIGSSTAGNNVIFMSQGYNVNRISTHAIENYLENDISTSDDAVGFTYQQNGHTFYVLTLVTGNKTFVYDLSTNEWHTRTSRDAQTNDEDRWDPIFATFAFGEVLVGTLSNARLLKLDLDRYYEWDGRPIVRLFQSPIYFDNYQEQFHKEFVVDMETGVGQNLGEPFNSGIQTSQAYDPKIMLQYSDDSGHTWSNEIWTDLGKAGEYLTRARWRRLGRSRARVYRIKVSSPNKVVIIGARITTDTSIDP